LAVSLDLLQSFAKTIAFDVQIVGRLQIQPEAIRRPEEPRQAKRGVAEIERCPRTISLIRRRGTWIRSANRYWVTFNGLKNSSAKTSPGWTGGSRFFPLVVLRLRAHRARLQYCCHYVCNYETLYQLDGVKRLSKQIPAMLEAAQW
jgi:hypothetical protein